MKRDSGKFSITNASLKKSAGSIAVTKGAPALTSTTATPNNLYELFYQSNLASMRFLGNNIKTSQNKSILPSTPLLSEILPKLYQRGSIKLSLDDKRGILKIAKLIFNDIWCHKPLKEASQSYHPIELIDSLIDLDDDELSYMTPRAFHESLKKIFLKASDLHTNYVSLATPFLIYVPIKIEEYWVDKFDQRFIITSTNDQYSKYIGKTVSHWNGVPLRTYLTLLGEYSGGSNEESKVSRALEMLTIRNLAINLIPVEDFVVLTLTDDNNSSQREEIKIPWEVYDPQSRKAQSLSSHNNPTKPLAYEQSITFDAYLGMTKSLEKEVLKKKLMSTSAAATDPAESPFIYEIKTINGTPWGYIKITTFAPPNDIDMPEEFIKIAEGLKEKVEGLIIDLRDNGGGNVVFSEDIVNYLRKEQSDHIERNKASFRLTSFNKSIVKTNAYHIFDQWAKDIKGSWSYRQKSGDIYSKGFVFRSNINETEYWWGTKQKVLLTNARCYSATDSFAACFQDNQCGIIIGQNNTTGGGGANVFDYSLIRQLLSGKQELLDLDGLVNFRVAIRRTTRRKVNSGLAIEDLGITPDMVIRPTKGDYETGEKEFFSAVITAVRTNTASPSAYGKAIYFGEDTRQDWFNIANDMAREHSKCVGAIFDSSSLELNGDGKSYTLAAGILGKSFRLQRGEKFWDQPSFDPFTRYGAHGTAFLIDINGREYLITAGHCVINPITRIPFSTEELVNQKIVFGFKLDSDSFNPLINIPSDRVYHISSVISSKLDNNVGDWAVCLLDRPVNRNIVTPCTRIATDEVALKVPLYVLGHPSGLPLKQATGIVRDIKPPRSASYFRTDLTTFAGNSGSPVFNSQTHQLVGILVSGATDYEATPDGTYRASVINYWGNDVGEDVTRIMFALKDAKLV